METHERWFQIGGGVVFGLLLLGGTIEAAEVELLKQDIDGVVQKVEMTKAGRDINGAIFAADVKMGETADVKGGATADVKEGGPGEKRCKDPLPCMKRRPNGTETAENGAVCKTSSWVCSNPYPSGQPCGDGTGVCHTYEVKTGGVCDCVCN